MHNLNAVQTKPSRSPHFQMMALAQNNNPVGGQVFLKKLYWVEIDWNVAALEIDPQVAEVPQL